MNTPATPDSVMALAEKLASAKVTYMNAPTWNNGEAYRLAHDALSAEVSRLATGGADPELTDKEVESGWLNTFSTNNPFCPCDLKSFTKAARWAEATIRRKKLKPAGAAQGAAS